MERDTIIYTTKVMFLDAIETPKFQRPLNPEKIETLKHSIETELRTGKYHFEDIKICRISGTETKYLIDGQHRLEALRQISQDLDVCIIEYVVPSLKEVEERYIIANNNLIVGKTVKNAISHNHELARRLDLWADKKYGTIESSKKTVRISTSGLDIKRPTLDLDRLLREFNAIKTPEHNLFEKLIEIENDMCEIREDHTAFKLKFKFSKLTDTQLKSGYRNAQIKKCFLFTLFQNEYTNLLKFVFQIEDKVKEYDPETKKPTHKTLWLYRCKNQTSHQCPIKNCGTEMVYGPVENFEMAHIIPKSQGGKFIQSNLIPTCKNCNRTMSTDKITKVSLKEWAWSWLPKN